MSSLSSRNAGWPERRLGNAEALLHLSNRQIVPMPVQVLRGGEGAGVHAVKIERAAQVIDLMLQNARIPTLRLDGPRFSVLVQVFDARAGGARHKAEEPGHTEAAFEEFHKRARKREHRVDDDVKWNGTPPALRQFFGRH